MFKKLKEKITEEVKSSPQRFQQLTQSVSDRLQNASTSDENFFSIGEDDANTSNNSVEPGFTDVVLMLQDDKNATLNSSSSIASDMSFLPRYDSFANLYHLQSDLDISASEIEDTASNSSQLGHLSKEQIYSAFQKSQMRYHKYRGRYTDLAKHYKILEKENDKMKSVLVETQDKAIRRVTELKEQCTLEQKAKAHLEGALRDDLDEKQMKIQTLQTKVELLQNTVNVNKETENLQNLNKYLTDARQEIENLNEKIQEMKANAIIFQTREHEYKTRVSNFEKEVILLQEREKENNLNLAQNKMELHNEILKKDNEITGLKKDNEILRKNLETTTGGNNKLENLQTQNKKLIDKVESLTLKCNNYESELLKMDHYKVEAQNLTELNADLKNKIKELGGRLDTVKEDAKKSILSLENKVQQKLQKEFEEKEEELKNDFKNKLHELSSNVELEKTQLNMIEKEEEIKQLTETNIELLRELNAKTAKFKDLESNHLELIEDGINLRSKISNFEKELAKTQNDTKVYELKIAALDTNLEETKDDKEKIAQEFQMLQKEKNDLLYELQMRREEVKSEMKLLLQHLENTEENHLHIFDVEQNNTQLKDFRTVILRYEEVLQQKHKNLELKFEAEISQMRQELEVLKNTLKTKENENSILNEELKNLKTENETVLHTELRNSLIEKKQLEEKLQSQENEIRKLTENIHQLNETCDKLKTIENENKDFKQNLTNSDSKLKEIEDVNHKLNRKVEHSEQEMKHLTIQIENERKSNEDEIKKIQEENTYLRAQLTQLTDNIQSQIKEKDLLHKHENKKQQLVEEINLLKESLAKADTILTKRDDELKSLETEYSDYKEKVNILSTEVENYRQIEQELSIKNKQHEDNLKSKDLQIDDISKKLEQYNDLVATRNENNMEIFTKLSGKSDGLLQTNHRQNLQNLEEKLQNFEKTFSIENENFAHILTYLKQFEENLSVASSEKNQLENDKKQLLTEIEISQNQSSKIDEELVQLKQENQTLAEQQKQMSENILELQSRNSQLMLDSNFLSEENTGLITEVEELKLRNEEATTKFTDSSSLINNFEAKISELQNDIKDSVHKQNQLVQLEQHISQEQLEKQLLKDEIEELKSSINHSKMTNANEQSNKEENYNKEIESLRLKVAQYKSLDLTNKSSIEFYENELQKLKNQNEKLNRKLDETLVTLNHCSELSHSTEIEYLKNVLYNYMLGKESLVLARVIAAVCKFDPHQTDAVLAKEREKQTLLGQLGII